MMPRLPAASWFFVSGRTPSGSCAAATTSTARVQLYCLASRIWPVRSGEGGRTIMNLWQDFLINDGRVIHKWVHYFPVYERHLAWFRNKSGTFLAIGVSKGGSLAMGQRHSGPL